ncbi:MAG: acetyl-CoA carboxylase biotin carboxyl carrier protein subunit, partial [Proteobacteria bacterium]
MSEQWKVSGKRVELSATQTPLKIEKRPGGIFIIERDGKRERVFANQFRNHLSFHSGGKNYYGLVEQPEWGTTGSGGSESDLNSQFPGKIRKLLLPVGSIVEEGTPLLQMEAMKMEFSIKAPFSGTIEKWNVAEGEQVAPGTK